MNYVKYGGIQQYGQLLNGWMQYGVLGSGIEEDGTPQTSTGSIGLGALQGRPAVALNDFELRHRILREDDELMEIAAAIVMSGVLDT